MDQENIAIIGAGAIACGLAVTASLAPDVASVHLWARSEDSAERARERIAALLERLEDPVAQAPLAVDCERAALRSATFMVEAIAEDLEAKSELLGRLARESLAQDAILATTTSSLPLEALAAASGVPERFVALHVFNPVTRMELVELAFPDAAAAQTRARARALCEALGKTAIEVPDSPGFVVNRLLFPYLFDAVRLLEQTGMEAAEIDACMALGAGHPLGPLAVLDLVGLDVSAAIGERIGIEVPLRLRELVAAGQLGRKTGAGFHQHP
jgi:3-hydroxybutyryl-CoA dehydrogenase